MRPLFLAFLFSSSLLNAANSTGLVEPLHDVWLSPPVAGRIGAIAVREGESVQAGDLLVTLDARIEELEVERRRLILEDTSELQAARARNVLIKQDLDATRGLFERTGSVSREELAKKETEHKLSEIEVSRLEQEKIRQEAELSIARERLALSRLIAPFDGIVADIRVEVGEGVQAIQPVLRIVDPRVARLVVNIPAALAASLLKDAPAQLRFSLAGPLIEKEATVDFISPVIDPASGLREVKFRFDNSDPRIEPGRTGEWIHGGVSP